MTIKLKNLALSITAALLSSLASLGILEALLQFMPVTGGITYQPVDESSPIQRLSPNSSFVFSKGVTFELVNRGRVNNYGFVNDLDYDAEKSSPLLSVVGDSFVEALMVPYRETLQGRLAAKLHGIARVYSFGISGAPLSQYLKFAEYARDVFHSTALVIVIVGNDFDESYFLYKPNAGGFHYFDENGDGKLVLRRVDYQPNRLRRLFRRSALVRYLYQNTQGITLSWTQKRKDGGQQKVVGNTRSDYDPRRLQVSKQVVDQFLAELPARSGLLPDNIALIVDGLRPQLYTRTGLAEIENSYIAIMRRYFIQRAAIQGFEVIDMQPRFMRRHIQSGVRFEFVNDSHWNSDGHREAAMALQEAKMFSRLFK
jgi:hypothetical protein